MLDAVRALGAEVHEVGAPGHLPVEVIGGTLAGGEVAVRGDVSSQFLSGLLLAGPAMRTGLVARLVGDLVSEPYVDMTVAVMASFGVEVRRPDERTWRVEPQAYRAADLAIEPDASAASYVFAAAALLGGRATVAGLGEASLQGDLAFVDVLGEMGADGRAHGDEHDRDRHRDAARHRGRHEPAVRHRPDARRGGRVRRGSHPGHRASGSSAARRPTGSATWSPSCAGSGSTPTRSPTASPSAPQPMRAATIQTYDDHRMAMAFALAGLRFDGVQIADPAVVAKTFPGYWQLLDELRAPSHTGAMVRSP